MIILNIIAQGYSVVILAGVLWLTVGSTKPRRLWRTVMNRLCYWRRVPPFIEVNHKWRGNVKIIVRPCLRRRLGLVRSSRATNSESMRAMREYTIVQRNRFPSLRS